MQKLEESIDFYFPSGHFIESAVILSPPLKDVFSFFCFPFFSDLEQEQNHAILRLI